MRLNTRRLNYLIQVVGQAVASRTIIITQRAARAVIAIVLALRISHPRGLAQPGNSALTQQVLHLFTVPVTLIPMAPVKMTGRTLSGRIATLIITQAMDQAAATLIHT